MNLTCPRCSDLNPANAERCDGCDARLLLFPVNTRCCRECGISLRGRHLLTRFCSSAHRKRHWKRSHPQAKPA